MTAPIHEAVRDYIERGWRAIVVKERSKLPASKSWQTTSPSAENFGATCNVGVVLGPKSGNLVDIDLDSPEARAVAALPGLLGDLPAFGREGQSPPGHRLVVCPDLPENDARVHKLDVDGCVLEVRAGRGYTVMPPSVHEAKVVWSGGEPPASIPEMQWEQLRLLARLTGLLALALRHYPKEGTRDDFCMHLGGALMHFSVPGETGDDLLRGLATLAGDNEIEMRSNKCSGAHARREAGENITGLPRLIDEYFGAAAGKTLRRWLGEKSEPKEPIPDGALQVGTPRIWAFFEAAQTALLDAAPHIIFRRSGTLTRVRVLDREETEREGAVVLRAGTTEIAPVTEAWLRLTADRLGIRFFKVTGRGRAQLVPPDELGILLVEPEDTRFPRLMGVSTTPTLARDEPGYDLDSHLLLEFPAGLFPPAPKRPTKGEAREALDRIAHPLREFPFKGPGSRSVVLSAILCGVTRGEMRTCPLHAFSAPVFGTGKTKLADIVSVIVTGVQANIITYTSDDDEMQKRLFAVLLRGGRLVNLDNVSTVLKGDFLSAMLTSSTIDGRVLGESRVIKLDTRMMVLATGNNMTTRGDLARRTVICRLDAEDEEPDKRRFDFDPVEDVTRERGQMVVDALTVLRAYIEAGNPGRVDTLGSFPDWDLVRGTLVWLEEADPLEAQAHSREGDEHKEMVHDILAWLHDRYGEETFTMRKLAKHTDMATSNVFVEYLPRNEWSRVRAGMLLGRIRDIPCGGLVLCVRRDKATNTLEYHVKRLSKGGG